MKGNPAPFDKNIRGIPKVIFNNTNDYPQKFLELLSDTNGYVLDCGSGDRRLDRDNVINLDIMRSVGVDVIGDGHRLPFKDNSFALILSQATLEHYKQPWIAAEELYRVCKKDGLIYAEAAFLQPFHAAPYHFFNMTLLGIEELFNKFDKIESGAFGGLSDTIPWIIESTSAKKDGVMLEKVKLICSELDSRIKQNELENIASGVFFYGKKTDKKSYLYKNQHSMERKMSETFEIRDDEIDVEEIMRKIKENIRMRRQAGVYPEGDIEEIHPSAAPDYQNCSADGELFGLSPEARRDLDHINSSWDVENRGYSISSHRPVAGRFLIRGRELVHGEVRRYVDPAIWKQREFNGSAVRLLNDVVRCVDQISLWISNLDETIQRMRSEILTEIDSEVEQLRIHIKEDCELGFDRIVSETDSQVEHLRSDIEDKVDERHDRIVSEMSSQIEHLRSDIEDKVDERHDRVVSEMSSQIEQLRIEMEEKISGQIKELMSEGIRKEAEELVRSIVLAVYSDIENKAWLANRLNGAIQSKPTNSQIQKIDASFINYFIFSEEVGEAWSRISGPPLDGHSILRDSIKLFKNCRNVLDIGCGQGSFLQILKDNRIGGYGIEINDDYVIYCRKLGLNVEKSDAIKHLESLDDNSLDGIFMNQVAEHLPFDVLYATLELCYRKLQFGSSIVIAIPNILSMIVSTNLLYLDPNHKIHVHPEVLKYILRTCGFKEIQEDFYQPVPDELMLKKIDLQAVSCMEAQRKCLEIINKNIDMLNNMLFGHRDYVVIAKK